MERTTIEINTELRELYSGPLFDPFKEYAIKHNEKAELKIANPFLLSVPDGYAECRKRVMIVGQETLTWYGPFGQSVEYLMERYDHFVNKGESKRSPIWNQYKAWCKLAKAHGVKLVANNIAKAGHDAMIPGYDRKAYELLRPIFLRELEICRPDVIIFVTGPNYDNIVTETMQCYMKQALQGFSVRQFAELAYKDEAPIKIPAWRTYHPGYINRRKDFAPMLAELEHIITE